MSELPPILPTFDAPSEKSSEKDNLVLIFSFEKDVQVLFETLLQIWDYQTEKTDTPEHILSIVKNRNPNLILMDSSTPFEMTLEIIRRIRKDKFCQEIPIILLSGFSQPSFRNLSLATGADDFIVKPVDFDLLKTCVEKNIEKYQGKTYYKGV